jgi:hypothetical protein
VHIKFKDWPLNQPLIAPNSCKNPMQHSQQGVSGPGVGGGGNLSHFLFFFFLPTSRRQNINQNQTLWHPGPLACGKPPYTTPHWEKQQHFSTPAASKAACMNLQNEQVSIMHNMQLPHLSSGNIIQCSPWVDWAPSTKLKNMNSNL